MKRTRTKVKLRGKTYHVVEVDRIVSADSVGGCYGATDPPHYRQREIYIEQKMSNKQRAETLIHEMLHACVWDLREEAVEETARSITNALYKLGYVLTPKNK